jgi:hypothetical protein
MTWRVLGVALALPILFTGLVLINVQRNRSGGREPMELTQREVSLGGGSDQNSGMTAWLTWSRNDQQAGRWLTPQQLEALGFALPPAITASTLREYTRQLPRRVYVVLELRERQPTRSRLVPVDAGLDPDDLATRYPDGKTHLITAGVVALRGGGSRATPWVDGDLVSLDPRGIHVPRGLAERLRLARRPGLRFMLSARYGTRFEPWIVDVQ